MEMSTFTHLSPQELGDNIFQLIGQDWMLITAGTPEACNTMTASWGAAGILWNKPIAIAYVRPTRYTYEFMEEQTHFSLSVLPDTYREALRVCGTKSGREMDKFAQTGLSVLDVDGVPAVEQSRLILICRKLYVQDIRPENFVDPTLDSHYSANDYHRQYIGEIVDVLQREQ